MSAAITASFDSKFRRITITIRKDGKDLGYIVVTAEHLSGVQALLKALIELDYTIVYTNQKVAVFK
jgi:hypothetical protein